MREGFRVIIVLLLLSGLCYAQEYRVNTNHKIKRPATQRQVPEWNFEVEPTELVEIHNEAAFHPNAISVQQQNEDSYSGVFTLYKAKLSEQALSRELLSYINCDGTLNSTNYVSQYNNSEGTGSIAIDPETYDPIYAWECYTGNNPYPDIMLGMDAWHLLGSPGLLSTPIMIFNNNDADEFPEYEPQENRYLQKPIILISHAPSYNEDGKRRVFVIASQPNNNRYDSDPLSQLVIAWTDFTTTDIEWGNFPSLDWSFATNINLVEPCTPCDVKTHFSAACDESGNIAIVGWKEGPWDQLPQDEPEFFVLYNDNYGEGDWELHETNLELEVDSPSNQNGVPWLQGTEELAFAPVYAGNFTAQWDDEGRLHVQMPFTLRGLQFRVPTVWPLLSQVRDVFFDIVDNEFYSTEIYPQSTSSELNVPFLPWDINKDEQVDEFDPQTGQVVPVCTLPFQHWDMQFAHYLNGIKSAVNLDFDFMACTWMDALDSYIAHLEGEAKPPNIMVSISNSSGLPWADPIIMSPDPDNEDGNFVDDLEGQIPNTPNLQSPIAYLGDYYGRVGISYIDEYSHGPYGEIGGTLRYMWLSVEYNVWVLDNADENAQPVISRGNHPNPFNPSTTISFDLPTEQPVTLEVYNIRGQKVKTLVNSMGKKGINCVVWNGDDMAGKAVSSGIYFYRLQTENQSITQKMLMVK